MRPVIGITCGIAPGRSDRTVEAPAPVQYVQRPFIECVERSGGLPLLLPCLDRVEECEPFLDLIHGLLIPGGVDPDPQYFGALPHRRIGEVDPLKDELEIFMIRECITARIPVLGICRGIQMFAVACGGTIFQDLAEEKPDSMNHMQTSPMQFPWHDVEIQRGSRLAALMGGSTAAVNSSHHQAVSESPDGFEITAFSADGVIEGLEHLDGLAVGVQWHPERSYTSDEGSRRLFAWLIESAAESA